MCLHCGHPALDEKVWQGTGAGMALGEPGGLFTKRNKKSIRFLACARCGFVASFAPTAEAPLSER